MTLLMTVAAFLSSSLARPLRLSALVFINFLTALNVLAGYYHPSSLSYWLSGICHKRFPLPVLLLQSFLCYIVTIKMLSLRYHHHHHHQRSSYPSFCQLCRVVPRMSLLLLLLLLWKCVIAHLFHSQNIKKKLSDVPRRMNVRCSTTSHIPYHRHLWS